MVPSSRFVSWILPAVIGSDRLECIKLNGINLNARENEDTINTQCMNGEYVSKENGRERVRVCHTYRWLLHVVWKDMNVCGVRAHNQP